MNAERLSNENFIDSLRVHARFQDPCEWVERGNMILVAGAADFGGGYWNGVARTGAIEPEALIETAFAFFRPRNRPFSVSVIESDDADLEAALKSAGFKSRLDIPCMVAEAPVPVRELAEGVNVEFASDEKHVADFIDVSVAAYSQLKLEEHFTRALFSKPAQVLREAIVVIAYRREAPLAAALATISGEGGGIYWVGTKPEAGRGGLGTICAALATNAAFERGAKAVGLQATPFGKPVYERLGYRTYDRMRWYGAPPRTR